MPVFTHSIPRCTLTLRTNATVHTIQTIWHKSWTKSSTTPISAFVFWKRSSSIRRTMCARTLHTVHICIDWPWPGSLTIQSMPKISRISISPSKNTIDAISFSELTGIGNIAFEIFYLFVFAAIVISMWNEWNGWRRYLWENVTFVRLCHHRKWSIRWVFAKLRWLREKKMKIVKFVSTDRGKMVHSKAVFINHRRRQTVVFDVWSPSHHRRCIPVLEHSLSRTIVCVQTSEYSVSNAVDIYNDVDLFWRFAKLLAPSSLWPRARSPKKMFTKCWQYHPTICGQWMSHSRRLGTHYFWPALNTKSQKKIQGQLKRN